MGKRSQRMSRGKGGTPLAQPGQGSRKGGAMARPPSRFVREAQARQAYDRLIDTLKHNREE